MPHIVKIPPDEPLYLDGRPIHGVVETYPREEGFPPEVGAFDLSYSDGTPVGRINADVRTQIIRRAYGEEE